MIPAQEQLLPDATLEFPSGPVRLKVAAKTIEVEVDGHTLINRYSTFSEVAEAWGAWLSEAKLGDVPWTERRSYVEGS